MQVQEIRRITNTIKKRLEIEDFIESELFLNEFPEDLRNFLLNNIDESFNQLKKYLFQTLKTILVKHSNHILLNKVAEFFQKQSISKPLFQKFELDSKVVDDYDQLIEDLNLFFEKTKKRYSDLELF